MVKGSFVKCKKKVNITFYYLNVPNLSPQATIHGGTQ